MSKQRIPPFLNNPPFSPTPPFLEKMFHLTLIAKLDEVNPPFVKVEWGGGEGGGGGGGGGWEFKLCSHHLFLEKYSISDCFFNQ